MLSLDELFEIRALHVYLAKISGFQAAAFFVALIKQLSISIAASRASFGKSQARLRASPTKSDRILSLVAMPSGVTVIASAWPSLASCTRRTNP